MLVTENIDSQKSFLTAAKTALARKGERLTYASYCRIGANDLPFYVLDQQMPLIEGGSDPAR